MGKFRQKLVERGLRENRVLLCKMAAVGRVSGAFRALSQSLGQTAKQQAGNVSVQKRSVGNLPVKPNSYVEDWAFKRENVELTFRFDAKTLAILGTAGVVTPFLIYQLTVNEFVSRAPRNAEARPLYRT